MAKPIGGDKHPKKSDLPGQFDLVEFINGLDILVSRGTTSFTMGYSAGVENPDSSENPFHVTTPEWVSWQKGRECGLQIHRLMKAA